MRENTMKRIAIRNKTEGRIVLNGMKGIVLVGYSSNQPLYLEIGEKGLEDLELIGLQQANLIEVTDADSVLKPAPIVLNVQPAQPAQTPAKTKPAKKVKKGKQVAEAAPIPPVPPAANNASGSQVTVMTSEGPKKGSMKYSIAGDSDKAIPIPAPKDPDMLDLNNY